MNRVRVLGSGPHTPTQYFWQYPTLPPPLPLGLANPRTQMYFRAENTYRLRAGELPSVSLSGYLGDSKKLLN